MRQVTIMNGLPALGRLIVTLAVLGSRAVTAVSQLIVKSGESLSPVFNPSGAASAWRSGALAKVAAMRDGHHSGKAINGRVLAAAVLSIGGWGASAGEVSGLVGVRG